MNLFIALDRDDGSVEFVTAPLTDGTILPGVTRDSVLSLCRAHADGSAPIAGLPAKLIVSERNITMPEIVAASKKGQFREAMGCGTAAIVCTVDRIGYKGSDIMIPIGEDGLGE